ncbi:putative F-box associated interaction domain-containing protein [Helianthus annuus]|nr:putative F-box associated interaction domain-containing protein [Helianthus annuus]
MTLHVSEPYSVRTTQAEHLNGLVFFTWVEKFGAYNHAHALVVNPSTHKSYEPTYQNSNYLYEKVYNMQYFFGYDESRNEHKILMIRTLIEPTRFEIMIFSMSSYSWRKIDVELSIAFNGNPLHHLNESSAACVDSVVYIMLLDAIDILAFDFRMEKLSTISTPQGVVPHVTSTSYIWNHAINNKSN